MFNIKKEKILEYWIANKISTTYPLDQKKIEKYQLDQINHLITYVKRSPYYREKLKEINEIYKLKDIEELPFTTVEDIATEGRRMICVDQGEVERIVTLQTSGTTGREKRLYFSQADLELVIDFFHYGLSQFVEPKDRVLTLMPSIQENGVGNLIKKGIMRIGADAIGHGFLSDLDKAYHDLKQSNSIIGTPIQVLALSRYAVKKGFSGTIKGVLLSADQGTKGIFREIGKNFKCTVYNHYGITEAGLGGAVDCVYTKGMHPRAADLYFEIIDPKTKKVVEDGIWGEIVFTTLTRKAMPLIRYRTGDYGRKIKGSCQCGSPVERLDKLKGRIQDSQTGEICLTDLDEILFTYKGLIDYSVEEFSNGYHFELYFFPWDIPGKDDIKERITTEIGRWRKEMVEVTIEIEVSENFPSLYYGKRRMKKSITISGDR